MLDFVSPVRLPQPELIYRFEYCYIGCASKVSMTTCPVPDRKVCAEDDCQEDGPAVQRVAGHFLFLLLVLMLGAVTDANAATCSAGAQTGPEMVLLPGGTYLMGSEQDEEDRDDDEGPVHEVTVAEFAIAVCEVCLLYTSPSPRDQRGSRMPSSA